MGKAKPWQIALFIAAIAAMGLSFYYSFGGSGVKMVSSLRMADVNTGEIFYLPIGKGGAMIPGRNPKTQDMTLLPVADKDGTWQIEARYYAAIKTIPGTHAAVDATTHEVKKLN
jgi:hypothetical protein